MKIEKKSWISIIASIISGAIVYCLLRSRQIGFSKELVGETIIIGIIILGVDYLLTVVRNKKKVDKNDSN